MFCVNYTNDKFFYPEYSELDNLKSSEELCKVPVLCAPWWFFGVTADKGFLNY